MSITLGISTETKSDNIKDQKAPTRSSKAPSKTAKVAQEGLRQLPSIASAGNDLANAGIIVLAHNTTKMPSSSIEPNEVQMEDPFTRIHFPPEKPLSDCLTGKLTPYDLEKGIVSHATSFFANQVKVPLGVRIGAIQILWDAEQRGVRVPPVVAQLNLESALFHCASKREREQPGKEKAIEKNHPVNQDIADTLSEGATLLRMLASPIDLMELSFGTNPSQRLIERAADIESTYGVPQELTLQAQNDIGKLVAVGVAILAARSIGQSIPVRTGSTPLFESAIKTLRDTTPKFGGNYQLSSVKTVQSFNNTKLAQQVLEISKMSKKPNL